MADITLSDLLTMIVIELSTTIEQTAERSELVKMQVSDIDLEIPAHLRLQADSATNSENSPRLMVGLPSLRETAPTGRIGRIRISIEPQELPPQEPK
jgi:aspartate/methionine/tyrosine aminotransferase